MVEYGAGPAALGLGLGLIVARAVSRSGAGAPKPDVPAGYVTCFGGVASSRQPQPLQNAATGSISQWEVSGLRLAACT